MNVDIEFKGNVADEDSYELQKLAEDISDEFTVAVTKKHASPRTGVRDDGLIIGIAIANLTVAAIAALFTILSYWNSTRPTYTVYLSNGENEITFGNLSQKGMQELVKKFEASATRRNIRVWISKKRP